MLLSWVPSRQQSNPFQPVFCRGHSSVPWIVLSMEKAYQGNFAEPPVRPPNRTQQTAIKDFLGVPPWPITEMWGTDALRTLHLREPGLHGGLWVKWILTMILINFLFTIYAITSNLQGFESQVCFFLPLQLQPSNFPGSAYTHTHTCWSTWSSRCTVCN